jgi:hypothetical protein
LQWNLEKYKNGLPIDMEKKKLNHYSIEEVIETCDIVIVKDCIYLTEWVETPIGELSAFHLELLSDLPNEYIENAIGWNEEELKMFFISPIFKAANVNEKGKLRTFFERPMSGKFQNISISVVVDCMIATPTNAGRPAAPYFFLQEFKRSKGDSHDPEGQMLAAMILAQETNQDKKPVYGCWLQGKNWYFTVLNGMEYCASRQYDATREADLFQIVFILRKLKELILAR